MNQLEINLLNRISESYSSSLYKKKNTSDVDPWAKEAYLYQDNQPKNQADIVLEPARYSGPTYKSHNDSSVNEYTWAMYKTKPKDTPDDSRLYREGFRANSDLDENNLQAIYGAYDFQGSRHCPPPDREKNVWNGVL